MWHELLYQGVDTVCVGGEATEVRNRPDLLLPGSFNPLHEGHRQMARVAEKRLGCVPQYELSIINVDKPPLDKREIEMRLAQFLAQEVVWLTRAPTFLDKARLFPRTTFVVGADTITRVADPFYYDNSHQRLRTAIQAFVELDCRFLVFGRLTRGAFQILRELRIDDQLLAICDEVSESEFRRDVSSTQIRNGE